MGEFKIPSVFVRIVSYPETNEAHSLLVCEIVKTSIKFYLNKNQIPLHVNLLSLERCYGK